MREWLKSTGLLVVCFSSVLGCADPELDEPKGSTSNSLVGSSPTTDPNPILLYVAPTDLPSRLAILSLITPNRPTTIAGKLHLRVEVQTAFVGELKGCATGYSTEGLPEVEISREDRRQLALCAKPSVAIQGLEGWSSRTVTDSDKTELRYEATPLLRPHLRVFFVFAIEGRLQPYIFVNP